MILLCALAAAIYIVIPGGMLDPRSARAIGLVPQAMTIPVWPLIVGNALMRSCQASIIPTPA